ncbi:MAG: GAF domain-containing protein [Anaerolineales bacterium]
MTPTPHLPENELKTIQGRSSPVSIFLITILGIALAEVVAMIVVYFERHLPYYQQVLVDATVMTVIIFPILYYLSFRPILQHIKQRHQVERILQSRLRIIQYANTHSLDEILQFILDELEFLTGSTAGYFHFVETDQKTIDLQNWSTNTLQNICHVPGVKRHYSLENAGVWADCIRQRRVVIHNDYASLPNRKGLPEGHAPIIREMAVPVIRDDKIVAVLGVGNKPEEYTSNEVELVSTLADFAWDIVRQKQTLDAQRASEEKFRTLVDWTYDWELWVDPDGKIIYSSPACKRITGYEPEEFTANPDLLVNVVHEDDRLGYKEHHDRVHDQTADVMSVEFRIVTRDGAELWIEHVCRPLFGVDGRYLGRRVSNRDITERKRIEAEIQERNLREKQLNQMIHTMQLDIARDLHDTIGQNIGYLRMKLDYMVEKDLAAKGNDLKAEFSQMSQVANESYDLVRGTLAILQSQGPDDLLQLFKRYADQVVERSALEVEFTGHGKAEFITTRQMRQMFYIFREALNDIEKHSCASRARVDMSWENNAVRLSIHDNGKGFEPSPTTVPTGHYGLMFMRQRAEMMNGTFQVKSELGAGTQIMIEVPIQRSGLEN